MIWFRYKQYKYIYDYHIIAYIFIYTAVGLPIPFCIAQTLGAPPVCVASRHCAPEGRLESVKAPSGAAGKYPASGGSLEKTSVNAGL